MCPWRLAAALLLAHGLAAAAEPLPVRELAAGVFVYQGQSGDIDTATTAAGGTANIGFIAGERCVAAIDSGVSRAVGERLLAAIRQHSAKPVCYLILTHAHIDHVFGAAAFRDAGATLVGHRRLPVSLSARARTYLNFLQRELGDTAELVLPTLLVEDRLELDLGNRRLLLRALPTGHTDADLIVEDAATGTLWLSDVLFAEHIPALDGSILGWIASLVELRARDGIRFIPGHGPAPAPLPEAINRQINYLERLVREVRTAIKQRRTIQEAVDSVASDELTRWVEADRFHRRNLTATYAELEWED